MSEAPVPERIPPDEPDPVRHLLATVAYRFQSAVHGVGATYADFDAGHGVRSPRELLLHCVRVLRIARSTFEPTLEPSAPADATWEEGVALLHAELAALDAHVVQRSPMHSWTLAQLVQGPFADVLTHVGQLALLRRLHGEPAPRQSYLRAKVETGRTGSDQPLP